MLNKYVEFGCSSRGSKDTTSAAGDEETTASLEVWEL